MAVVTLEDYYKTHFPFILQLATHYQSSSVLQLSVLTLQHFNHCLLLSGLTQGGYNCLVAVQFE